MMGDTPPKLHRRPLVGGGWAMPWLETAPVEQREQFIDDDRRDVIVDHLPFVAEHDDHHLAAIWHLMAVDTAMGGR